MVKKCSKNAKKTLKKFNRLTFFEFYFTIYIEYG